MQITKSRFAKRALVAHRPMQRPYNFGTINSDRIINFDDQTEDKITLHFDTRLQRCIAKRNYRSRLWIESNKIRQKMEASKEFISWENKWFNHFGSSQILVEKCQLFPTQKLNNAFLFSHRNPKQWDHSILPQTTKEASTIKTKTTK